jgi:hypothetical protein
VTASRTRASLLAVALSVLFIGGAPPMAVAQGEADAHTATMRNAARAIGEEALAAFEARDYETALAKFDQAEALVPVPTLGVRAARCLVELGRWNEAVERYARTERMTIEPTLSDANRAAQAAAQREAATERTVLEPRIPALSITVEGPPPDALWLDDAPLSTDGLGTPRRVDPGRHAVRASRAGVKVEQRVELAEGAVLEVALRWPAPEAASVAPRSASRRLAPAPDHATRSPQEIAGWIIGSTGVLSVGAGIATYVVAADLRAGLDAQSCADEVCRASVAGTDAEDDVAAYNAVGTTSLVLLVAGSVLTAGGVVLLLTAPDEARAAGRLRPALVAVPDSRGGGAGFASMRGTF